MSRKPTVATALRVAGVCLLLAAASPALPQSALKAPVVVVQPMTLGRPKAGYGNPAIAVAPNGAVTVVAESGGPGGHRLVAADLSPVGWSDAVALAVGGAGDSCNPSMTYDSSATLHLVWSEKQTASYAIHYAFRPAGKPWQDGGIVSVTPDLECEFPHVAGDRNGRVWMTWQAGRATRYSVYLAWRDGATSGVLDVTGARRDHHNLYPQVFPDSPYPVVWYEETENIFQLRSIVPAASGPGFQVITPLEADRLDANQMPWLFEAPSGMLGGVWKDLIGDRVRVLVGFQSPSSRGEGFVADATLSGDASQPYAAAVGKDAVAVAWTGRLATGSVVYVGRVDGASRVGPALALPVAPDGSFGGPRLATGGGNLVHCVWFSDATRGGTGSLYYAALRF